MTSVFLNVRKAWNFAIILCWPHTYRLMTINEIFKKHFPCIYSLKDMRITARIYLQFILRKRRVVGNVLKFHKVSNSKSSVHDFILSVA